MEPLLVRAQIQRVAGLLGDREPEQVDVELPGCREVGDDELEVGEADDVERRPMQLASITWRSPSEDGRPSLGIACSPSATWMVCSSQ